MRLQVLLKLERPDFAGLSGITVNENGYLLMTSSNESHSIQIQNAESLKQW
jgi:hypothetical protein